MSVSIRIFSLCNKTPNKRKLAKKIPTYSNFTFDAYSNAGNDYSGNKVTGVPDHVSVTGLHTNFPADYYLFTQY
ncbi:MAG: hypothetical protein V4590_06630 [Bacteroidota bacterium]